MNKIDIRSSLYNYSAEIIDDFSVVLSVFGNKAVYVVDKNVYNLYKNIFSSIPTEKIYLMNAVESNKNMDTVMDIILFYKNSGVKKDWKIICFGGGITQDVTTIASNLYLRNVEWYFFPTTLLSMCDSCIGGKCGINLKGFKNQIGVFYPPKKIFIYTKFLETLTHNDYVNGWGEILKFSLTLDDLLYKKIKTESQLIPCDNIGQYIYAGLEVKKNIIEQDEFDTDLRRVLNYGHSFGHALEAYTNNEISHGKGVIWGIDVVNYIAAKEGLISKEFYLDIKNFIKKQFIKEEIIINDMKKLIDIMRTDKKVVDNIINLALLDKNHKLIVYPMSIDDHIIDLFREYLKETHDYYSN